MITRRKARPVQVGKVQVGGDAPVSVQTMTKTRTEDVAATVRQIKELEDLGCQIIRLAVPTMKAAQCLGEIKRKIRIPLVADIHFQHTLALEAIRQGVDKIRVNPGNMRSEAEVKEVVQAAKQRGVAIRIGVNSGSIREREGLQAKHTDEDLTQLMTSATLRYCEVFESLGFRDIVLSMKASDCVTTMEAYRQAARACDYPLHLGVTAAGPAETATIKSAIGIGGLLSEGIGDTIRVSFTGPPHAEVEAGYEILQALGLCRRRPEIVSCPSCGRCEIDLRKVVEEVRAKLPPGLAGVEIAIMGCVVNGPGEASEADIGIAGGKGFGFLFRKGERIKKVRESAMVEELLAEVRKMASGKGNG